MRTLSARSDGTRTKGAGVAVVLAVLVTLMALPSSAAASVPGTDVGAAQQLAQQITGAVLRQTPTTASIAHAVRTAMAADNAPASVHAIAAPAARALPAVTAAPPRRSSAVSARPAQVLTTRVRVSTRPAQLRVRGGPGAPLGALPGAPVRRHGRRTSIPLMGVSSTGAVSRSSYWLPAVSHLPAPALSDAMLGDRFVLTLLGLTGDTGFLQTIESAGGQILSEPSSQIVSDAVGDIPVGAQPPAWLTAGPVRDRPLRHAALGHFTRRLTASRQTPEPPAARSRSALQPVVPVGLPTLVRPSLAGPHPQERSRSGGRTGQLVRATRPRTR